MPVEKAQIHTWVMNTLENLTLTIKRGNHIKKNNKSVLE